MPRAGCGALVRWAALVVSCVAAGGCRSAHPDVRAAWDGPAACREAFTRSVHEAVSRWPSGSRFSVRGRWDASRCGARVTMQAEVEAVALPIEADVLVQRAACRCDGATVRAAVRDAADTAWSHWHLARAPRRRWRQVVRSGREDEKVWALRLLGQRPRPEDFETALTALSDPSLSVRRAALPVALAAVRPRHVPLVARAAEGASGGVLAALVEVMHRAGGPQARAWLEHVAGGHPDARIREMAAALLRTGDSGGTAAR